MRLNNAANRGLAPAGAGVLVPALEAVPAELIGGADLIGKPVGIDPTLLLSPPSAVPGELEHARLTAAVDANAAKLHANRRWALFKRSDFT